MRRADLSSSGVILKSQLRLTADSSVSALDYPLAVNVVHEHDSRLLATFAFKPQELRDGTPGGLALAESFKYILRHIADGRDDVTLEELGVVSFPVVQDGDPREADNDLSDDAWTEEELKARKVLSDIVRIDPAEISRVAPFYRLGLDSITVLKFARDLRSQGLTKSPVEVIQAGNLKTLFGTEIRSSKPEKSRHLSQPATAPLVQAPSDNGTIDGSCESARCKEFFVRQSDGDEAEALYDCTPLQCGMLTLSAGVSRSGYRQVHSLQLRPDVDLSRLRAAWTTVVSRNDVLRTTFHFDESANSPWVAIVHKSPMVQWHLGCEEEALDATESASPVAVRVVGRVAHFSLHHAVYDGVSLPMIFAQLREAYLTGTPATAQPAPFFRVAHALASQREHSEAYWMANLKHFGGMKLRSDLPNRTRPRAQRAVGLSGAVIRAACMKLGVTLQAVCMLANAMMLAHSYVCYRDVSFAHVMSCRQLSVPDDAAFSEGDAMASAEDVVGPLFNTVVRRIELGPALVSFSQLVARVQEELDRSMPHQGASLANVQKKWRHERKPAPHYRLIDSLFVFHKAKTSDHSALPQERPLWTTVEETELAGTEEEYPLNVSVVEREDGSADIYANSTTLDPEAAVSEIASGIEKILGRAHCCALESLDGLWQLPRSPTAASSAEPFNVKRSLSRAEVILQKAVLQVLSLDEESTAAELASPDADVLAVGIDSINAIRLARLCRTNGLERISVPIILRGQTLGGIIALCDTAHTPAQETVSQHARVLNSSQLQTIGVLGLAPSDVEAVLPCLPGQLHHLEAWLATGRRFYEAPWVFDCSTKVNPDRFDRALEDLRAKYSTLRTCFVGGNGTAQQIVLKPSTLR